MKARKYKVLLAFGTRPEALKFAPVFHALERDSMFKVSVCLTGQHRQMLDQVINFFHIPVHSDLRLMRPNQTLEYVSGSVISRFGKIITRWDPDVVFVQGDTTTALMVGIATFYAKRPLAHLEAGLRTWNKYQPFPEEMNRKLLSHLADFHFTPTRMATTNLINEGISEKDIYQVGNTIVDTVKLASERICSQYPVFRNLDPTKRLLFVTAHRRESFGRGLEQICRGLRRVVECFQDVEICYPVHLNPNVQRPAYKILGGVKRVHLMRPFSYEETVWMLKHCYLVLTDSGGIQEEAPTFHKPVLILRNLTERWEGIQCGIARLVGTDEKAILRETTKLLRSRLDYQAMASGRNPYGDGKASERIVRYLKENLERVLGQVHDKPLPRPKFWQKRKRS